MIIPDIEKKRQIKSQDMAKLADYRKYLRKNPRLTYLFAELTDMCNLRCLHCGSSCGGKSGSFIDTDMLINALEGAAQDFDPQTVMICITGGEPLLHPDFEKIVRKVSELGFPWGMTTNGTLIDDQKAAMLKSAGMRTVSISIDGLEDSHNALRRSDNAFALAVSSVGSLNRVGIPVQITTVVHGKNYNELDEMLEMVKGLNVRSWRLVNIEPIGRALENKELLLSPSQFDGLIDFVREKRNSPEIGFEVCFGCSHYLSFEAEREVRDNYFICGSGIYVGSILVNGDIYSCLDIERRPELVQGNIGTDRFSEVWKTGFSEFRRDRTELCSECFSCPEKEFCGGDSAHTWNYDTNEPMFCLLRKGKYYGI